VGIRENRYIPEIVCDPIKQKGVLAKFYLYTRLMHRLFSRFFCCFAPWRAHWQTEGWKELELLSEEL